MGIVFMAQPVAAVVSDSGGSGVVTRLGSAQTGTADLKRGSTYHVWIVASSSQGSYSDDPEVISPAGEVMSVSDSVAGSRTASSGNLSATLQWKFTTDEAGSYQITAPHLSSGNIVVTSSDVASKMSTGLVVLFVGIGVMVLGFVLTLVGIIVWVARKKKTGPPAPVYR